MQESQADLEPEATHARSPRWFIFGFLSFFALRQPDASVSTGTLLDVLGRVGTSAHAARSALTRMTESGAIVRQRRGRETYYSLSPRSRDRLHEANANAWRRSEPEWNGTWTILGYSIPESRSATRMRIRSRLLGGGFGLLRNGMWVAPGAADVQGLLGDLGVMDAVQSFIGTPLGPTGSADIIREAFDLDEIADRYERFLRRWTADPSGGLPDELCTYLALRSEWQQLVQADPRLPSAHLPSGWPAATAEQLFRDLTKRLEGRAWKLAEELSSKLDLKSAS
jgi:phenylacetic acid degradation operon negative regulatory protein